MKMATDIQTNPLFTMIRAIGLWLRGRVHLDRDQVGDIVRNGEVYTIFRKIVVDHTDGRERTRGAILKVRFRFARGSVRTNMGFSLIPVPFIVGVPGFRSKVWMVSQETSQFQGVYEWDTAAAAEAYMKSFAIRLMMRRVIRETVSHEITSL